MITLLTILGSIIAWQLLVLTVYLLTGEDEGAALTVATLFFFAPIRAVAKTTQFLRLRHFRKNYYKCELRYKDPTDGNDSALSQYFYTHRKKLMRFYQCGENEYYVKMIHSMDGAKSLPRKDEIYPTKEWFGFDMDLFIK